MLVTDIAEVDKKRKKIYIDYEYAYSLYNSEIRRFHVQVGSELDELTSNLIEEVLTKRVKARSLYILKNSDKTERQLYDKLLESGYTDTYASIGVEYAKSYGYIDDRRYAECYINGLGNKRSKKDIKNRLISRGVPGNIIEDVLSEAQLDETEAIWNALRKKSVYPENIQNLDPVNRNKIYAYLMRRGFNSSTICALMKETY